MNTKATKSDKLFIAIFVPIAYVFYKVFGGIISNLINNVGTTLGVIIGGAIISLIIIICFIGALISSDQIIEYPEKQEQKKRLKIIRKINERKQRYKQSVNRDVNF